MSRYIKKNSGFTLIELLIVIAIIGVLAAIAIPQLGDVEADEEAALANMRTLMTELEALRATERTGFDRLVEEEEPEMYELAEVDLDHNDYEYTFNSSAAPQLEPSDGEEQFGIESFHEQWDEDDNDYAIAAEFDEDDIEDIIILDGTLLREDTYTDHGEF